MHRLSSQASPITVKLPSENLFHIDRRGSGSGALWFKVPKGLWNEIIDIAHFTNAAWPELVRQWIREKVEHYQAKREYRDFLEGGHQNG